MADEVPHFLCYREGIYPVDGSKYERIDQVDGDRMYFFANWRDNTKIIIMYETE